MRLLQRFGSLPGRPGARDTGGLGIWIAGLAAGIVMFLLGFVASFPDDSLREKLQYELSRQLPGRITMRRAEVRFPFSLAADDVRYDSGEPGISELAIDSIRLTPHLSSLFGRPGASFAANAYDGRVEGSLDADGVIAIDVESLEFDEPVQGFSELRLAGSIRSARLASHLRPGPETPTSLSLLAGNLALTGTRSLGLPVNRLDLGQLDLTIDGVGRDLAIRQGTLSGGAVSATVGGRIAVGRSPAATRISLDLNVKPAATLDPSVASLFDLLGTPDREGGRKLTIRGSLARPVVK